MFLTSYWHSCALLELFELSAFPVWRDFHLIRALTSSVKNPAKRGLFFNIGKKDLLTVCILQSQTWLTYCRCVLSSTFKSEKRNTRRTLCSRLESRSMLLLLISVPELSSLTAVTVNALFLFDTALLLLPERSTLFCLVCCLGLAQPLPGKTSWG